MVVVKIILYQMSETKGLCHLVWLAEINDARLVRGFVVQKTVSMMPIALVILLLELPQKGNMKIRRSLQKEAIKNSS